MPPSDSNKPHIYVRAEALQQMDRLALIYHRRGVFGLTKRDGSINKSALLQYLIEEAAKREGLLEKETAK